MIWVVWGTPDGGEHVQVPGNSTIFPAVDLSRVPPGQRADVWSSNAATLFPGAAILNLPPRPTLGEIARIALAEGVLWHIHSPPSLFNYQPLQVRSPMQPSFGLLAQLTGTLRATQSDRECAMEPGDLCFLDACDAFRVEGPDSSEFIILEMPREAVVATHPFLASRTACVLKEKRPDTTLLRNTLLGLATSAPCLSPSQSAAALAGIMSMLGAVDLADEHGAAAERRMRDALSHIELHLTDRELSAVAIAARLGISRRRLDELFIAAVGKPVAAHIWQRRFARAEALLRDPDRDRQCIRDIARASGFEDTAHFVRAFKRRYGLTPGRWRLARAALLTDGHR
jgi:AraC-like DNA-binding protein